MAVKLRMKRLGRRHRPFFRINAIDSREPRNGKIIENIGYYDPIEKDEEKQLVIDKEKAQKWLDNGAIPSETVSKMLEKVGIPNKFSEKLAKKREKARSIARKKGVPYNEAERKEAARKAEEAAKKAEEEAKKAEEEAKKAEEEAKAAEEASEEGEEGSEEEKKEESSE